MLEDVGQSYTPSLRSSELSRQDCPAVSRRSAAKGGTVPQRLPWHAVALAKAAQCVTKLAALPPVICAFGDSLAIGPSSPRDSSTGLAFSGEADPLRSVAALDSYQLSTITYGRGGGVGRGRRVGCGLGVTLGVAVGLTLGEGVVVGVTEGLGVTVGVGVTGGVAVGVGVTGGVAVGVGVGVTGGVAVGVTEGVGVGDPVGTLNL